MAETRTARFGLPRWSSGADSGSRADFVEGFDNLDARAAYDDGVTSSAVPTTGLVAGRYAWVAAQPGGGTTPTYRSLYRRADDNNWYHVGGPTIPTTQLFRGLAAAVSSNVDADAVRVEHPLTSALGGWGANITYAGWEYLRSGLVLGSTAANSADLGKLAVGGGTAPAANERAVFRASADGEHAIVGRTSANAPGDLLRLLDKSNSPVFRVDGAGQLVASRPSAFGGAPVPTTAMLAVAPSTSPTDGLTAGLLLHGHSAAGLDTKSILQVWRDAADTAPIVNLLRDSITVGRLPWSGALNLVGDRQVFRSSGRSTNPYYWRFFRSDPTSAATEADPSKDSLVLNADSGGFGSFLPTYLVQTLRPAATTLTVWREADFVGNFMDLQRRIPDGSGGYTFQTAAMWASDGKLRTGVWWKGTGTLRDARQSVTHTCPKRWVAVGSPPTTGPVVAEGGALIYTWPVMTVRSIGTTDLGINLSVEILYGATPDKHAGVGIGVKTEISIDGGAWSTVATSEDVHAALASTTRQTGTVFPVNHRRSGLNGGATFQLRSTFSCFGSDGIGYYLRGADLTVAETMFESYTAA